MALCREQSRKPLTSSRCYSLIQVISGLIAGMSGIFHQVRAVVRESTFPGARLTDASFCNSTEGNYRTKDPR